VHKVQFGALREPRERVHTDNVRHRERLKGGDARCTARTNLDLTLAVAYADRMPGPRKARSGKTAAKKASTRSVAAKKASTRSVAAKKASTRSVAAKKASTRSVAAKKSAGTTSKRGRRTLSAEHKAQLARGREEARIVRAYLEAIDVPKRRGRQRTAESISSQLSQIDERIVAARGIDKLALLKQRRDLEAERVARAPATAIASLERDFTKVARSYGARKGIDYSLWRAAGVPAAVLSKARIQRTRRPNGTRPASAR
jgi:hypothetical protein